MVYTSGFNLFIRAMEIAVIVFAAACVALGVLLIVLRRRNGAITRHRDELQQRWQKTFRTTFTTPAAELPPVLKNDRYDVLLVFNQVRQLRQSDRETDRDGRTAYGATLNDMARRIGLDVFAQTLLDRKDDADKIAALNCLCWLGDARVVPVVRNLMKTARASLSRTAAEALLRLDPASAEDVIVQVRDRFGYVRARVELMFREVGTARLDPAMKRVIAVSDDRGKMRLLDYLSCASPSAAREICRDIVTTSSNGELVAAALKTLATVARPEDAGLARRFAEDERSFLRLAALRVLKETATKEDLPLLERLTSDSSWWVRQRAAETLVSIDTSNEIAARVLEDHEDPYARAAVTAALASQRTAGNVRTSERRADTRERSPR
ncbi:MAG TPA: HEAT repeat domain-containing protein [Candidatus Baltobacteraceae bacterium]|nr:HEAT repeat domain-containing protein [Candidatus Baltobacteraceae bacterium]